MISIAVQMMTENQKKNVNVLDLLDLPIKDNKESYQTAALVQMKVVTFTHGLSPIDPDNTAGKSLTSPRHVSNAVSP